MTEFIIGKRGSGKTTELIKRSAETGAIIVVPNMAQADFLRDQAKAMSFDIPKPISMKVLDNIVKGKSMPYTYSELRTKGILVDELQTLLYPLFGNIQVDAVTITDYYDKVTTLPGGFNYKED